MVVGLALAGGLLGSFLGSECDRDRPRAAGGRDNKEDDPGRVRCRLPRSACRQRRDPPVPDIRGPPPGREDVPLVLCLPPPPLFYVLVLEGPGR